MAFKWPIGNYKGKDISELPMGYLTWAINRIPKLAKPCIAEIERRGHKIPKVEITGHALDRASIRVMNRWMGETEYEEGLHSWLTKKAIASLATLPKDAKDSIRHEFEGMIFVYDLTKTIPVLLSIWMPGEKET